MKTLRQKYSRNFLRWARHFARSGGGAAKFDRVGLEQFHKLESNGIRPSISNPYFQRLDGGRRMFNALQKQVRESYGTPEWQGYADDKERMPAWLFEAFYGWHPRAMERE